MASNRCFNTLNKTIVNSSDLTNYKKQLVIYKNLSGNATSINGPDPKKKNGSYYNDNFIVKGTIDDPCLASAKNYELLLDITKGKKFANPILDGASAAKYEMWSGNVIEANYYANNVIPVRAMDPSGTDGNIKDGSDNTILFPSPCIDDCSWNNSVYPGYTIDPSQTLFYKECDDTNKLPAYINVCDVSFRSTNYYWKAVSANPLKGMRYPTPIKLRFQDTNVSTPTASKYAPQTNSPLGISGEWCDGKYAFN